MSLWSCVSAISALRCVDAIKYLPPDGESAGVAAVDHGAGHHRGTRSQVGKAVEVDIVEDASPIGTQRLVIERPELLVAAMLRAQACRHGQDLVAGGGRDQHLDSHEVRGSAFAAIFFDPPTSGNHWGPVGWHSKTIMAISRLCNTVSRLPYYLIEILSK